MEYKLSVNGKVVDTLKSAKVLPHYVLHDYITNSAVIRKALGGPVTKATKISVAGEVVTITGAAVAVNEGKAATVSLGVAPTARPPQVAGADVVKKA